MLYINGEWCEALGGETYPVHNPATGELIKETAKGGKEDAQIAIGAAKEALSAWSKLTAKDRYVYLKKAADLLRDRVDSLANTITTEMGKPLAESRGEVQLAAEYLDWYAEEGKRIYGDTVPSSSPTKRILVLRQPIGVVGAITPWNFPIAMILRKVAPALAAGCTVVIKPAESTPLTAIEVMKAFHDAGLPKGVLNLVHGMPKEIGDAMMESPDVRKITFTGSTKVGKELAKRAADTMKKISMELGGHAPFLIFEDADLEKAADGVIASKFRNAGQTCVCTNRVYVQKSISEKFAQILTEKMTALVVGNGLEDGITIGPLINENAVKKTAEHVEDSIKKGAKLLTGGKKPEGDQFKNGFFYEPTILAHATHDMKIASEETFGPVAPLFDFETEEEAVALANNTVYGLAAYFYTNDVSRIFRVSESLEYGIIGINDPLPTVAQAPFGGVKESGVGREGGKYGIEDYLEYKYLSLELNI
ncbi:MULTISPECIES: NAD-dependent succinate-semialdehyde dehydrogenase [unclassified Niallia]|uniref:NAD-dependent succinate-semialdehyde dehydrogenase n=1 Tax=unclassified Niallia TaxID=2837522 RepID=UPI001EDC8784|nr:MULTISPECIES: NAD-dependent succinate-semialdehyde dehydrogenase [unclassified Niallia]MCM3029721.1 NAD-dependent succinate-semialdehyde dehydrogenase [Niallia sp. MER 6]MDL0437264.1 NAD-dependent succinate-semialdehyde dehydrogenase [Niallia sp. SS-2023]UPO87246.1 NAD-dependent succinate-semialdehyde dehydrogenase [Niallia sp. Man26]